MNKVNYTLEKSKLLREKAFFEQLAYVNGNLALQIEEEDKYEKPSTRIIHVLEPEKKVFMGCWNVAPNENNGQDGC